MCYCVALSSDNDWKMNQKAVLCALQTYDVYQKERVDSVKYIQHKSMSTDHTEPAHNDYEIESATDRQTGTAVEVMP